jgi:23S rRNA (adenine2030-N6)-methyltransferase
MNYRHAFHAGNHADVLKHAVLCRILLHLSAKATAFSVLDAHAGIGLYDLSGVEAGKTFEWDSGIAKLAKPLEGWAAELIAPYLDAVKQENQPGRVRYYPGSPALALRLSRIQDTLYFNELHPEDHKLLDIYCGNDKRVRLSAIDATTAIKASLPFKTGRGLVLIDPPYEAVDEVERVERMLEQGLRRMAHATYMVWYPITDMAISARLSAFVGGVKKENVLKTELLIREPSDRNGLAGSGLIIINPPWKLHDELTELVPALADRIGIGKWGRGTVKWLAPPK